MKHQRRSTDIPLPAANIAPVRVTVEKGTRWWRVHPQAYRVTEFNPNTDLTLPPGRFHPFIDAVGNPVPTLYGSNMIVGALAETVFHNTAGLNHAAVPRARFEQRVLSQMEMQQVLTLASLKGPDVKALGVLRKPLVESFPDQYRHTAAWAQAIHAADKKVQGMLWVSGQHERAQVLVLFGDRIPARALKDLHNTCPLLKEPVLSQLRRYAARARIALDLDKKP